MADADEGRRAHTSRPKRADARRNQETLLDAAAAVFVEVRGGGGAVRDIAAGEAGVGTATDSTGHSRRGRTSSSASTGTRWRLCAEAGLGPCWRAARTSYAAALGRWIDLLVDFLVTKLTDSPPYRSPTTPASRRRTRTSPTASCPCAPASSTPRPPPGEIRVRTCPPWNSWRGVGNSSASARRTTRAYDARTPQSPTSSRGCADRTGPARPWAPAPSQAGPERSESQSLRCRCCNRSRSAGVARMISPRRRRRRSA